MAVFNLLFTLDCWFDLNIDPTVMQKIYLYEKKINIQPYHVNKLSYWSVLKNTPVAITNLLCADVLSWRRELTP